MIKHPSTSRIPTSQKNTISFIWLILATCRVTATLSSRRQRDSLTRCFAGHELAADLRLERSASGLTVRFPHPVGLSAKISWSGVRESNPPHLLGRQRPKAARPTPLSKKSRALCLALRLPVSMRRIVACAGLWAGVFGWFESVDPRSRYLFAPGLAPEARPIRIRSW